MRVPEIRRQLAHAGVQQVGIFENFVVEVVFGREPERARLDAHVDVFADQDHLALGVQLLQMMHDAEDLVVGFVSWRASPAARH